jgi:hypothetical protein
VALHTLLEIAPEIAAEIAAEMASEIAPEIAAEMASEITAEIASEMASEMASVPSVAQPRAITAPHRGTTARLGRLVGARYGARCSSTLEQDACE